MEATKREVLEALERAMATEMEGYQFYIAAAALTGDTKGKEMFQVMAKDEIAHFHSLKLFVSKLREKGTFQDGEKIDASGKGIPILPPEESLQERLARNPTEIEALKIGIDIEAKAVKFYSDMLQKSNDPEISELMAQLKHMENGHLTILQGEYDSVSSSGFWCDHREFSLELE